MKRHFHDDLQALKQQLLSMGVLVEETIRNSPKELTRTRLYHVLEGRVMYQTLKVILDYLEKSNKIVYSGNKVVWVFTNEKLDAAVARGNDY